MNIFGKSLKEYLVPIKYYIIIAILVVISQYYVGIPLQDQYPFFLNLTQGLWAAVVALSVIKLVREHDDFGIKNVLFLGVLYSIIIHGLKAFFFRAFLFPYMLPAAEIPTKLLDRFLYGSSLVMLVVIILGPIFVYLKRNGKL